ncbi:TPA: hypothetical protein N0F65_001938 [Lagenidium giganteum]|uniref:MULE transposase domain-containing protein n=1 Tax=Lagenidium giganteum TaxID=4803 RepID=A0AAV2YY01_9STRA|nr:TPA: hypothetical protein N0F65_001938 [Lagenidium giganteum]
MDDNGHFCRAVLIPLSWEAIQCGMQRVFGIDGAHLKHRQYHGTQLCLVGRDGDFHNVVLAVAVAPRESKDNYAWFLRHIEVAGYPLQHTPLFCDRHTGLVAAGAN